MIQVSAFNINYCRFQKYIRVEGGGGGGHFVRLITLSLPESIMETCSVVLTFKSVDKILWCDHNSNETSSAVLLHGAICFSICYKTKFRFFLAF